MTGKVYLRKKVAVPRLIQVQESQPASRKEVTISHLPLQTESELELPIAIRKGMKQCTKRSLYSPCCIIQKVFSVL